MKKQYIAIDQYGQIWKNLEHPRKDLMEKSDAATQKRCMSTETMEKYIILVMLSAVYG